MESKEYESQMLKNGLSSEAIRKQLKEMGYIKKADESGEELPQELREWYEEYFDSVLRDFRNAFLF